MREGLRSGKLRARPKRDEILSEKKVEVENPGDKMNDVNLDGGEAQFLWVGDKEAVVPLEQVGEDVGAGRDKVSKVNFDDSDLREQGESEIGESESKNQSMREDCCDPKATSRKMANRVAADDLDGAEPFLRHVLRSMTISVGESEKREREEDEIVSTKVKKKRGRPPKIEKAEVDENAKDEIISAKVKKKRGRPPKIKEAEIDESEKEEITSTEVKKKRGRPLNIKEAVVDENKKDENISAKVKKKRGRPPKIKEAEIDESEKEVITSTDVKKKRGRPLKFKEAEIDESKKEAITSTEVKKKRGRPPKIKKTKVDENNMEEITSTEVKKKRGQAPTIIRAEVGENKEDKIISTGVKKTRGRPPKIKKPEIDENKKDTQLSDNQVPQKLKRKRGRPCKSEISMIEGENGYVSRENQSKKRGRPHKKRGRPPKEGASTGMPAKKPLMVGNVHGSRRNHRFLRVKRSWKKLVGKALNRGKRGKKGKLMRYMINRREGDGILENGEGNEESNIREGSSREEKQLVREKIMKLILGAGWTVQYKPREGRGYQDAIYVSPNGRAYWSITLAYKILKRHYEEDNGESSAYTKGFVFNPITNEELRILARITEKKRKDMGRKDCEVDSAIKKKKLRGKRNSGTTSFGGPVCAKVRGGTSLDRESLLSSDNMRRPETENNKRRGLLVRKTGENESSEENYILYKGKRTVLAWMIDMGVVPNNGVALYRQRKTSQTDLDGWFTKDGIRCSCCDGVVTITEFEAHAGHEGWNMALQNILLDNKISLLQCELTSWNKQEESVKKGFYYIDTKGDDPNDDTCGICGDGGNLVCCESCPSTFHLCCLGIKKSPSGDWHCPYCSCKYCGMVAVSTGERTNDGDTAISALNKCLLCEEKFHRLCVLAEDAIEDAWASRSFCGKKCLKLHKDIEGLLGVEHKLEKGYSCTLVRRSNIDFGITTFDKLSQKVHSNSKVAVALSIMDECFLPVDDRRSGINLIHNILYNCGSNFNRLNFSGFYTAVLEKGDEMISVASIRIHGNLFAEMPFIGTRYMYRRQGMCRCLLTALESILCTLKVEKLVIPAIDELKETWTSVFGFEPVRGELRKRMRNMNVLAFPGVDMLQKQLSVPPALVENVISIEGPFSTQDKDMNKDGSDITNDGIQFSDSENGKNQIILSDEPSDAEEKCGNIMDPLPDDRESLPDLSACLNLETPGADVELKEKTANDVGIIPCVEPCRSDVEDEESLVISISNGGSKNLACDRGTKSRLSEVFSENVLDDKEGLAFGNESLSPGEPFHDAEEEILAGTESPPVDEGELPSSECKTEHPLHQAAASNNQAPSTSPGDFHNEVFPLQDIIVGSGQVLVGNSNHVPSSEEGTKSGLSGEFLENVLDGNEGFAPVPSQNELFYDAKEETLTLPGSPSNSNEKLPSDEFESDKTLRQPTDASGHYNQVPPATPGEVSPFQNKQIQDIMDVSTREVPVDPNHEPPGEVSGIPDLDFFEDK